MKNRVLLVLLTIVLVVSLLAFAACKAEEEEPPPPPPPPPVEEEEEPPPPPEEEVWEWPSLIPVLSPPVTAAGYGTMVAWTALMQEDSGMQVRCVPLAGGVEDQRNLKQGTFLWSLGVPAQEVGVLEGIGGYATRDLGPYQVRGIWPASVSIVSYMVRGDSDIRTPEDIKPGTKIAYPSGSPMGKIIFQALLAWAQVDEEDVVWVPAATYGVDVPMVSSGQADICFTGPTSPVVYEAAGAPHGIAWIDLDVKANPEGAKRFSEVWPHVGFGVNEMGEPSSIGLNGLQSITCHYTRADADTELVYRICKWLHENYDEYQYISPVVKYMDLDTCMLMTETSFVPIHDGTVKYLKEIGEWTPAHEARNKASIDLITRYVDAYAKAIDMADEELITVDPTNEEWLELWENYKEELKLPKFVMFTGLD